MSPSMLCVLLIAFLVCTPVVNAYMCYSGTMKQKCTGSCGYTGGFPACIDSHKCSEPQNSCCSGQLCNEIKKKEPEKKEETADSDKKDGSKKGKKPNPAASQPLFVALAIAITNRFI